MSMAEKVKKGLGTGLEALFGSNRLLDDEDEGQLLTLPISKVEPRREQPRMYFDEQALNELADSIARYGVIQPVTVRRLPSGYYQIIAGERRWRASRLAGLSEIPVRIIEADDRRASELALVENLQREDLNPIEEAKGYQSLIEDFGLTHEEAANSVGRSRPAISNSLRLLSLSPKVMELVEKGELSAGHARALVPIEDKAYQLELAQQVIRKGLSVRKTEQLASAAQKRVTAAPALSGDGVDYAAEVGHSLSSALGRRVVLHDGKKTGKIELEFYGAEDREALIAALSALGYIRKEEDKNA